MSSDHSTVIYRELEEYPGYRVGDDGNVQSCRPINGRGPLTKNWRTLKAGGKDKNGYPRVTIARSDGSRPVVKIHHLVLSAFVGKRPPGMEACHEDGNPEDNRLCKLHWDTRLANAADSIVHGTQVRGIRDGNSKLTEEEVLAIRGEYRFGVYGYSTLGKKYGVRPWTIRCVVKGISWKHVGGAAVGEGR